MKKIASRLLSLFFFGLGTTILIVLIQKFGWNNLLKIYEDVGPHMAWLLILPAAWTMAQAIAWKITLPQNNHVSIWKIFSAKLVGESVNTLTPVSFMGGDPVRIYMLQKSTSATLSTASVVIDRTLQSVAVVIMVLVGFSLAYFFVELPKEWETIFPALTLLMLGLVSFFMHRQKSGIFKFLTNLLAKFGISKFKSEAWEAKIETLDHHIRTFYQANHFRFFSVLGLHVIARILGILEIYLIAHWLHIGLSLLDSLFLATLTVLVNLAFVFIPGSLGVMEGAYGALCFVLGVPPVSGIAIQLVRRARTLFWVFLGLLPVLGFKKTNETLS